MSRCTRIVLAALAPLFGLLFAPLALADDLKPLDTTNRGTIKGRVVFAGAKPPIAALNATRLDAIKANIDKVECLKGKQDEIDDQTWRIGKNDGLADVVVYVRPPAGSYFKLTMDDLKPFQKGGAKSESAMDQPHCAFIPRFAVAFPSYSDATGKQIPTGQVFKIKNSSAMSHNSKWGGTTKNPGGNPTIPAGAEVELKLVADRFAIPVNCGIHGFMEARILALDSPFYAVTDEDGNFEIKNVPAGVELQLFALHKTGFASQNGFKGETITVPVGGTLERKFEKTK